MLAFAALVALLPVVAAQSSGSAAAVASAAASVPSCALTCTLQNAGSSSCGGVTNVTCLCTDMAFQSAVFNCYTSTCTQTELQSAIQYGYGICKTVGVTLNTNAVPSGATATGASGSGSSSAASSAASSSATSQPSTTSAPASSSSAASSSAAAASNTGAASRSAANGQILVAAVGAIAGVAGLAAFFF